nr:hypothetical protein [Tanacetum cinerariifolium]
NLLKRTCKSRVELEFHFEECYKAVTDKLDWTNPEGHEYPFDLSKPLPLIKDQGHQVVPANYFFNNDLEYLKGGSLSSNYTTSTTKIKAVKYDNIEGIQDTVPSLWSPVKSNIKGVCVALDGAVTPPYELVTPRLVKLVQMGTSR